MNYKLQIFLLFTILIFSCTRDDIKHIVNQTDTCVITGLDAIECQDVQSECMDYDGFFQFHDSDAEFHCSCDC